MKRFLSTSTASAFAGAALPLTVPLSEARRFPTGHSPRVACRFYDCPKAVLPNGLPRTTPLVADALLVIADAYLVTARVLRDGPSLPPSRLQIDRQARDLATDRLVLLPEYAPSLVRAAYDILAAKQVLVNARRAALKARN